MNRRDFAVNLDKYVEKCANELVEEYKNKKCLMEIIEQPLKKSFIKIAHIDIRIHILISTIKKIKTNKHLYTKLMNEFKNIDELYNSLRKCELCTFTIFQEIENIIYS